MRSWKRIAVGYKASAEGRDALALAELLGRTAGGELLAVRVCSKHARCTAEELERDLAEALAGSSVAWQTLVRPEGSPTRTLLALAAGEEGVGLIVVGPAERRRVEKVIPGGVAERLLAGAPCSIAVAPRGYAERSRTTAGRPLAADLRVLAVGFDGSAESKAALELATTLAVTAGATLRVIAVGPRLPGEFETVPPGFAIPTGDLQAELHETVAALPEELRALPVYEHGEAAHRLLERAEQGVDLLVIGSRGHGPVGSALLGSTSAAVIAVAPCPVVVVPRPALSEPA
jgi:nucleotide-binding universal stress UspA family protein